MTDDKADVVEVVAVVVDTAKEIRPMVMLGKDGVYTEADVFDFAPEIIPVEDLGELVIEAEEAGGDTDPKDSSVPATALELIYATLRAPDLSASQETDAYADLVPSLEDPESGKPTSSSETSTGNVEPPALPPIPSSSSLPKTDPIL